MSPSRLALKRVEQMAERGKERQRGEEKGGSRERKGGINGGQGNGRDIRKKNTPDVV